MSVSLAITQPAHNARFRGGDPVTLRGSLSNPALFVRWYSSLFTPVEEGAGYRTTMNTTRVPPAALTLNPVLDVGSHVITLAALDQQGDDPDSLAAVGQAISAGGSPLAGAEQPCVIHVFRAVLPDVEGVNRLSRARAQFYALAPLKWGKPVKPDDASTAFTPDLDYHALNRIAFRWTLSGAGNGTFQPPEIIVGGAAVPDVTFRLLPRRSNADVFLPVVIYTVALGDMPIGGGYTLTLRVYDRRDVAYGHEVSQAVEVVN